MSAYPIDILKQSGRAPSSSGGKDYHLILITTNDGRGMTIFRFGRTGQWGTGWALKTFDKSGEASAHYQRKYREKLDGQYSDHFIDKHQRVTSHDDLVKALGIQYVQEIGKDNMAWLDPDFDTSKMKPGREDTEWVQDEHGRSRVKRRDPRLVEGMLEKAREAETSEAEQFYKSNPNFGAWG